MLKVIPPGWYWSKWNCQALYMTVLTWWHCWRSGFCSLFNSQCFTSGSLTVRGLVLFLFKNAFCVILAVDQQNLILRLIRGDSRVGKPQECSSSGDICVLLQAFWRRCMFLWCLGSKGSARQSTELCVASLPGPACRQHRTLCIQNPFGTGLTFAKGFQTEIQRGAVRRNAPSNSSLALKMLSNVYNPSALTTICKLT